MAVEATSHAKQDLSHFFDKVRAWAAQRDCYFASTWFRFVAIAVPGSKPTIGHIVFHELNSFLFMFTGVQTIHRQ